MILVDTSIWIELLNGRLGNQVTDAHLQQFVTCGPIAQEVLQGMRENITPVAFLDAFNALPRVCDPLPNSLFIAAAELYRQGRRRGFSIRSSNDCLIAAIAIETKIPVWHRDRDFQHITRFTPLETVTFANSGNAPA